MDLDHTEDRGMAMLPTDPPPITSLVVMGDSFSEGMQDDLGPTGRHLGWADRVAAALATTFGRLQYANLAVRGRLLGEVMSGQLPLALELRPALATFHAGANDVLRPRTEIEAVMRRYDTAVEQLRDAGVQTLLFTAIERAGGTGRTATRLAGRFAAFNEGVRCSAQRHGALLVDVGAVTAMQDRRMFHEDRLHLAPDGHVRVAAAVLETLGFTDPAILGGPAGWWHDPLLLATPLGRRANVVADVRWVRRHLAPWVGRRLRGASSGDLITAKHAEFVEVFPLDGDQPRNPRAGG